MIRLATPNDIREILSIYTFYVLNTHITFDLSPPSLEDMQSKITNSLHPWFVYQKGNEIVGYAYALQWKARKAYEHTVETSIYLKSTSRGKGIGNILYTHLIENLRDKRYRVLIGGISLPNDQSVALHEKLGFEKIGHFREVGFKFDQWIDVGYWELILNS